MQRVFEGGGCAQNVPVPCARVDVLLFFLGPQKSQDISFRASKISHYRPVLPAESAPIPANCTHGAAKHDSPCPGNSSDPHSMPLADRRAVLPFRNARRPFCSRCRTVSGSIPSPRLTSFKVSPSKYRSLIAPAGAVAGHPVHFASPFVAGQGICPFLPGR